MHNAHNFSQEIEKAVKDRELTYIEAICEFCKQSGLEVESVPRLLTPQIKAKIESEAIDLNMFKKKKRGKKLKLVD